MFERGYSDASKVLRTAPTSDPEENKKKGKNRVFSTHISRHKRIFALIIAPSTKWLLCPLEEISLFLKLQPHPAKRQRCFPGVPQRLEGPLPPKGAPGLF